MSKAADSGDVAQAAPEEGKPPQKAARAAKKCKCGHDLDSPMVSPSGEYTFGGWFLILLGISAKPTAIRFQCRKCDQLLLRSTDPKVIEETRLWG